MPKVRILIDTPGLPIFETRDFSVVPSMGDFVQVAAHMPNTAYKVNEIIHQPSGSDVDIVIILQADTGKNPAIQNQNKPPANFSDEWKKVFEHATAYNNVMILAGYAGLFAIWSLIKDKMDIFYAGVAAMLAGAGLIIFVLHEVIGMWGMGLDVRSRIDPSAIGGSTGRSMLRVREKLWIITFPLNVILGFSAAGILFWRTYVDMLFK